MGCSGWALDRGMDGTEERKTLVVGKMAGKFLEGRTVARGGWGMAVEEGWWHSFPAAAAATCGGGSGDVGLTAWVEREQSKGRRRSRRRAQRRHVVVRRRGRRWRRRRRQLVSFLDLP